TDKKMTGTRISLTIARLTAILRRSEFAGVKTLKNLGIPDCMKTPPRSITRMSWSGYSRAHLCCAEKKSDPVLNVLMAFLRNHGEHRRVHLGGTKQLLQCKAWLSPKSARRRESCFPPRLRRSSSCTSHRCLLE